MGLGPRALNPRALVRSLPSQWPEQKVKLREAVLSPQYANWQLKTPCPPGEALCRTGLVPRARRALALCWGRQGSGGMPPASMLHLQIPDSLMTPKTQPLPQTISMYLIGSLWGMFLKLAL